MCSGDVVISGTSLSLSPVGGGGSFSVAGPPSGDLVLAPSGGNRVSVSGDVSASGSVESPVVLADEVRSRQVSSALTLNGMNGEVVFTGSRLSLPGESVVILLSRVLFVRDGV